MFPRAPLSCNIRVLYEPVQIYLHLYTILTNLFISLAKLFGFTICSMCLAFFMDMIFAWGINFKLSFYLLSFLKKNHYLPHGHMALVLNLNEIYFWRYFHLPALSHNKIFS